MKVPTLLCCVLTMCSVQARDVYRTDDPVNGTEFSDVERPGATRITIEDKPTPPPITSSPQWSSAQPSGEIAPGTALPYSMLEITSPAPEATIRNNAGEIPVTVTSEPAIQSDMGHQLSVLVDGASADSSGSGNSYTVRGLARGTHTLHATVTDSEGNELISAEPVVVHLHRYSTKFRNKPKSPPPKPPSKK